ncbi:hypothetical protein M5K25_017807 [Dendrobium thyrsiflorum]|uniref:Bifunctional inhibitor/plant lipid transfer protein/seed storage helical domain-containing protein n=1 Tax=Dendrobium thyrsiflorum TaxID=117978 RepID=A0ABD0UNF2_DENTH
MAITRYSTSINPIFFFFLFFFFFFFFTSAVNGQQISTACTSSLISTFTPCFNFLTGSTNGGGQSGDCCSSLASLVSNSVQCACLILTGNVPLTLPFNKTISISLTQLCGSRSVPVQCSTAVGAPLPGPGPVSYAPSLPPLPPQPPLPSVNVDSPPPPITTSSQTPSAIASPPSINETPENLRPLLLPSSAAKISMVHSLSILLISVVALKYLF